MANINRYQPWGLLTQLHDEMDRLFSNAPTRMRNENPPVVNADWSPSVDVKEEKDRFVIVADVPGVDAKDISISTEHGVLAISGQRESETKEEREGYKRVERMRGTFYRSFGLPENVDTDRISAKSKNGVLEIVLPKTEAAKSRKITVES